MSPSTTTTGSPSGSDLSYQFLGSATDLPFEHLEPQARWHLVWCHERCRKEDKQPLHDALAQLVQDAGGVLFCVKKAKSFEAWRTRGRRHAPFLLLTDGREVKPCVVEMAHGNPQNRPLAIIVLSEHQKQCAKLSAWVQDLAAQGIHEPVRIARDVGELFALLPSLVYYTKYMAKLCDTHASFEAALSLSPFLADGGVYGQHPAWPWPSPYPCFPSDCVEAKPAETQNLNLEPSICSRLFSPGTAFD